MKRQDLLTVLGNIKLKVRTEIILESKNKNVLEVLNKIGNNTFNHYIIKDLK